MGKLIEMPVEQTQDAEDVFHHSVASENSALPADLHLWESAPSERSASYLTVYSSVSYAMQCALRQWIGEWVRQHPEVLEKRVIGYSLLAFSCTLPYRGRTSNIFTYDIQQAAVVDRALRTASRALSGKARQLDKQRQENDGTLYFDPENVSKLVYQKRRNIYRMFNIETWLMDEVLKFALTNIAKLGLAEAALELRAAFARHLHRFTEEFDLAERSGDLLRIATEALRSRNTEEEEMPIAA